MKNKVWIELPNSNHEVNAGLATKMLHKLGYNESVSISATKGIYYLILNAAGEFLELANNGHWFDLDFISE